MSEEPQAGILLLPILFLPGAPPSSQATCRLCVCVGGGRVVCVSLQPGSCGDESRLNVEPPAVLSRPALTHLSPKVPRALTEGSGACPMGVAILGASQSIIALAQGLGLVHAPGPLRSPLSPGGLLGFGREVGQDCLYP